MKKVFVGLMLSAVLLVNSAYANKAENVNEKVAAAFKKEFVQAKEVTWQKTDDYYRAVFKMNDDVLTAYFSEEGEMIGVTRNLLSTELPISLQVALKKDFSEYWITELFEFAKQDESGYFVTLENADQKITLHSTNGSSWTTFSKVKK